MSAGGFSRSLDPAVVAKSLGWDITALEERGLHGLAADVRHAQGVLERLAEAANLFLDECPQDDHDRYYTFEGMGTSELNELARLLRGDRSASPASNTPTAP